MADPAWTHRTAVVFIPPAEVWPPIQAIRRVHDRQFQRWMPHVTLLYPFAPRYELPKLLPALEAACAALSPFEATLASFRVFQHRSDRSTLWLAPEPREAFARVQALARLSETWTPLVFQATEIHLIAREGNGPFEVVRTLRFGTAQPG